MKIDLNNNKHGVTSGGMAKAGEKKEIWIPMEWLATFYSKTFVL